MLTGVLVVGVLLTLQPAADRPVRVFITSAASEADLEHGFTPTVDERTDQIVAALRGLVEKPAGPMRGRVLVSVADRADADLVLVFVMAESQMKASAGRMENITTVHMVLRVPGSAGYERPMQTTQLDDLVFARSQSVYALEAMLAEVEKFAAANRQKLLVKP